MPLYSFADVTVRLSSLSPFALDFLNDYRTDADTFDEDLSVTDTDLAVEANYAPDAARGVWEVTAVLRKLSAVLLTRYNGCMLHAAAIVYRGKAYAFVAPSGTGKTTHCRLWCDVLGDEVFILNGDKLLIRQLDGQFVVYGNPWNGKEGYGEKGRYPLGGVFLLRRARDNDVTDVSPTDALAALMSAAAVSARSDARLSMLSLLHDVIRTVPVRMLYVNMHPDAVRTAQRGMEEFL